MSRNQPTRSSGSRSWRKTRWQGVYRREDEYRGKLYTGKLDGKSTYEWTDPYPTGKQAADALAAARAARAGTGRRGRAHTVASWARASEDHPHGLWLALRPRAKSSSHRTYAEQVKPFVDAYGDLRLSELDGDVELALEWVEVRGMRWTLGGVRAMCTDARRAGHLHANPFLGLGTSTGPGRRGIPVLTEAEVLELAETAARTWRRGGYGQLWRAFVLWQAYVGTRPAEAYGLTRPDLDLAAGEAVISRQRPPTHHGAPLAELPAPKNGLTRRARVHPVALDAIAALPVNLRADAPLFHAARGGALSGACQHYYWHPIRCAYGRPDLDLYELRHFCGSYHLNDLELAAQDVAEQLGHTDGGVLVQRLYGHPSAELARRRIAAAHQRARARALEPAAAIGGD